MTSSLAAATTANLYLVDMSVIIQDRVMPFDELKALVGYDQSEAVKRWCRKQGVHYTENRYGEPLVTVSQFYKETNQQKTISSHDSDLPLIA